MKIVISGPTGQLLRRTKLSSGRKFSFENHDGGTLSLLLGPFRHALHDDPRDKALIAKMNFPANP